ncbi:hypothetical protein PsYK624_110390 [Phanerochaete sordida]|uniref:DUF7918 domain-containing protein n=1 Tax=Phanerochaete sordida TaxID=48140 RepID=A0A9P3GF19_9APHY|nr:hypothetical protein PsYK624_110390 [Phanerochaete sordida]
MKWKDFEAFITVGDHNIEEYDVKDDGENKKTGWIASEEGASFAIKVQNKSSTAVSCTVYIDGRLLNHVLIRPGLLQEINGARITPVVIRPFIFSRISVSDDDALLHQDIKNLEAIGTVRILIRRVTVDETSTRTRQCFNYETEDIGIVHERKKKAGVHCVSLGKEITEQRAQTVVDVQYHDTAEKPHCVFLFRYRSKDFLQAQGILPLPISAPIQRQVTPTSNIQARAAGSSAQPVGTAANTTKRKRKGSAAQKSGVKEESDDSDTEDADAIQAQLDALQARLSKAKKKDARKRVKREPSPILMQTSGDIIDLTSD